MENVRKIDALLAEYGESHQNKFNKTIHWICVPLIFWTITAMLWCIKFSVGQYELNVTLIVLPLVLVYYLLLSFPLTIGMMLFSIVCMNANFSMEHLMQNVGFPLWAFALIIFAIAWVFQFWGHAVEGKKPSFLKDLQFLLVGPAWLMHFIFKKIGIRY